MHFSLWGGVACLALIVLSLLRSIENAQASTFGMVLMLGAACFCYYLFLVHKIMSQLGRNAILWLVGALILGPLSMVVAYARILQIVKQHLARA